VRAFRLLLLTAVVTACSGKLSGPRMAVQVPPGASFGQIADTLHARGLVTFTPAFRVYARLTKSDSRVRPGTYGFRRGQSWGSILTDLREGRFLTAKLVIPEGWSTPGIAPRVAVVTGIDSARILDRLLDPAVASKYGVAGPTLEGYLYPATYDFALNVPFDTVISHMLAAYRRVWNPKRRARADSIKMTEREVITLASIVEKEAKHRREMPIIASVYYNRLRIGYPLQADPTVQYALGVHRERLKYSDIRKVENDPYNTYKIKGLPPGPIGSPSAVAIDATLHPAITRFLYFVARPDGTHIFTNSLDEHNRAKRQSRVLWQRADSARAAAGK
jgi:UPF0755 protein